MKSKAVKLGLALLFFFSGLALSFFVSQRTLSPRSISAQTETEANQEASPSAEIDSETTQNLKERIEKVVNDSQDKIEDRLNEISQQKRGYIGEVTRISENSLTVKTLSDTQIIPADSIKSLRKQSSSGRLSGTDFEDIAVGNWVTAIGYIDDDTIMAEELIVSTNSLMPTTYEPSLGTINAVERNSIDFTPRSGSDTQTLETSSSTTYQDILGAEITRSEIVETVQALVITFTNDDEDMEIKTMRILSTADDLADLEE